MTPDRGAGVPQGKEPVSAAEALINAEGWAETAGDRFGDLAYPSAAAAASIAQAWAHIAQATAAVETLGR